MDILKKFNSSRAGEIWNQHRKVCLIALAALIFTVAMIIGIVTKPLNTNQDLIICADGTVIENPWHITVDGQHIATLKTKEECEAVKEKILSSYETDKEKSRNKKSGEVSELKTLKIEFKEDVKISKEDMEHGDKYPEFSTVEETKDKLLQGNKNKPYVTVVASYEITSKQAYKSKAKVQKTSKLYVGQKKVKKAGKSGQKLVTAKVVKENGKVIAKKIIAQKVVKKATPGVILKGTKKRDSVYTASRGSRNSGLNLSAPLYGYSVSSSFGMRWGAMHKGVDMTKGYGAPIYAAGGGTVTSAGYKGGFGNLVIINHGNGIETYYAHCSSLNVYAGQRVSRGQQIAAMGATGDVTGTHLHFEVHINGTPVNPMAYI